MDFAIRRLVDIQYQRNHFELRAGTFRVRGDTLEVSPPYEEIACYVIAFWGDDIEGSAARPADRRGRAATSTIITIYPATHYVARDDRMKRAIASIEEELARASGRARLPGQAPRGAAPAQADQYDLEMLRETGFCSGIENYSRHIDGREAWHRAVHAARLLPRRLLCVIDESHVTVPQLHGMYEGDMSRKATLVDFGFRLPSAIDNRPLQFEEFARTGASRSSTCPRRRPPTSSAGLQAAWSAGRPADGAHGPRGQIRPTGPDRRPDRGDPPAGRGRPSASW